jgi:hypothetical protein
MDKHFCNFLTSSAAAANRPGPAQPHSLFRIKAVSRTDYSMMQSNFYKGRRISVAPMMDWTE